VGGGGGKNHCSNLVSFVLFDFQLNWSIEALIPA